MVSSFDHCLYRFIVVGANLDMVLTVSVDTRVKQILLIFDEQC